MDSVALPDAENVDHDDLAFVADSMASLPASLRSILELIYWNDLSAVEIARMLDIPAATVRSRLRRAKARLRRMVRTAR